MRPITGATAHTRILIILRAGHLSRHEHACARALYLYAVRAQRSALFRHAMPRRVRIRISRERTRISRFFSRGGPEQRAGAGRVSARVYARGHSRAGTRPAFQPCGHFLPASPHSSPHLLPPHRSPHLIFSSRRNDATMQCDAVVRWEQMRLLNCIIIHLLPLKLCFPLEEPESPSTFCDK